MNKFILIALFAFGASALAQNAPASAITVKDLTVANGQATLTVQANNAAVALTGPMDRAPQLQDDSGRVLANCRGIGAVGLECDIGYDGGNGRLAIFKKNGDKYALVATPVITTDEGTGFVNLVNIQNSRRLTPEDTLASLLRAATKANSISTLTAAVQADQTAAKVADNSGGALGANRPPVVIAPGRGPIDGPAGTRSLHTYHEEHHTSDTVIDRRDDVVSIPMVEESSEETNCIGAGGRLNCAGYSAGPAMVPGPGYIPGGPVAVGPPPPIGPDDGYADGGYGYDVDPGYYGPGPVFAPIYGVPYGPRITVRRVYRGEVPGAGRLWTQNMAPRRAAVRPPVRGGRY